MPRTARAALLVGVSLAAAAGCLVVAPLDELPNASGGAKSTSGSAGKSDSGDSTLGTEGGQGGTTMQGGSSGTGGNAAAGGCQTNAECSEKGADEPARCRQSDHRCVSLRHDVCPIVSGDFTNPNAVYFGAFATLDGVAPEDNSIVWAHELALDELSGDGNNGLPDGPKGKDRPLVMIVCNNLESLVEEGMQHLAEEVQVPAVIATLKPGDLRRAYDAHRERDIFYLSPVPLTKSLVNETDGGRIWNLLGQPNDFALPYAALLTRSEAWLRSKRSLGDTPVKVALVATTDAFDSELRDAVLPVLRFNGDKSPSANQADGNFLAITLDSSEPELEQNADTLASFQPDIVISTASELFLQEDGLQVQLESEWAVRAGGKPRPFYMLSPYNAGHLSALRERISGVVAASPSGAEDNQRYVGISIAPAPDITLQRAYEIRLRSRFEDAILDTANYYDAIYYLAYAMYADKSETLTGSGITIGMQQLFAGKQRFDIGPNTIDDVFNALATEGSAVRLNGTLGPPEFDPVTGTRPVEGGAFCFGLQGESAKLVPAAARYDRAKKAFVGDFKTCIPGF